MKTSLVILIILAALGAGVGAGYWLGAHGGVLKKEAADDKEAAKPEAKPTPTVQVVAVRLGSISDQITAYGTVIAPASEVQVVSVPFECRVTRVWVTPGQPVEAGEKLIEVSGSAATALALEEAKNTSAAASRDLQLVKQRYEQKLATQAEFNTAESAAQLAGGRLRNLQESGAGGPRELKADAAGIVNKVDVQIGQVAPIGGPLVEVATRDHIEVRLGAEPNDVPALAVGQTVMLHRTDDPALPAVHGEIRLIGQRVDPMTRLVEVLVSLPADAKLVLETFVVGQIAKAPVHGLIVPREAVLPGDKGAYTLFTIKDGQAEKHDVNIGIENDREAQIISDEVKEGDMAVIVGNFTLEQGMKVEVQPPQTQPTSQAATTVPATGESK